MQEEFAEVLEHHFNIQKNLDDLYNCFYEAAQVAFNKIQKLQALEDSRKDLLKNLAKSFLKTILSVVHAQELVEMGATIDSLLESLYSDGTDLMFDSLHGGEDDNIKNFRQQFYSYSLVQKFIKSPTEDIQILLSKCKTKPGAAILKNMYYGLFLIDYAQNQGANNWSRIFGRAIAKFFPDICAQKGFFSCFDNSTAKYSLSFFRNNKRMKFALLDAFLGVKNSFIRDCLQKLKSIDPVLETLPEEKTMRGRSHSVTMSLQRIDYRSPTPEGTPTLVRYSAYNTLQIVSPNAVAETAILY